MLLLSIILHQYLFIYVYIYSLLLGLFSMPSFHPFPSLLIYSAPSLLSFLHPPVQQFASFLLTNSLFQHFSLCLFFLCVSLCSFLPSSIRWSDAALQWVLLFSESYLCYFFSFGEITRSLDKDNSGVCYAAAMVVVVVVVVVMTK